ncbi:MAG: diguanylate cyclase domain-containing protein [Legionella sp.]
MDRAKVTAFIRIAHFYNYMIQCLEQPESISSLPEQVALFEKNITKDKTHGEIAIFYNNLITLHFLLGNIHEAVKTGKIHECYYDYDKNFILHGKFFYALALAQYLPQLPHSEQRSCFIKFKKLASFIQKCATWCQANFKAHSLLLTAELLRIKSPSENALVFYEQARAVAHASGFGLLEAIAAERAGAYCLEIKMDEIAKIYLQNAHQSFSDWVANTKVKLLERTYPKAIWEQTFPITYTQHNIIPHQTKAHDIDMLAIFKSTQLISSEIHLDKLLQKLLVIVIENAGAQKSIILTMLNNKWIIEAEGNLENQVIHLNNLIEVEAELKYHLSLLNYVQRTQEPIILNDAAQSELTFQDPYGQRENPRSLLMMPLFYKGQLCRMLYLDNNNNSYALTPSHLDSLQLLASQAMTSLENAKLYYQATHDPLTGLANRNLLYEAFQQLTQDKSQPHKLIALLFLDIDYFKVINDTLGHDNGDKLIIHIAKSITSCLGQDGIGARIGGDEFAIILRNMTSKEQITEVVKRLFEKISKPILLGVNVIQITPSMSISIYPKDGHDIQELLKLADTALYKSKEQGRNQFNFYSKSLY